MKLDALVWDFIYLGKVERYSDCVYTLAAYLKE